MIEIDMVVSDAFKAFAQYEQAFGAAIVADKRTNYTKGAGLNEAVFELQGQQFHLFDEKPEIGWVAPAKDAAQPAWFNLITQDAEVLYQQALAAGLEVVVPLTEDSALGVKNAVLRDSFGYSWVIEQIVRPISFAARCQILAERFSTVKTDSESSASKSAAEGGDAR